MINTINSDLIRGNINTIILKALYEGDRYGYDIVKEIEQKSSGQYKLKQPTLYSCLKRLEVQGFIRSYWGAKSNGGRRKYYTLTDMGRDVFKKNRDEWEFSRTVIDKLISDKEYDLSNSEITDSIYSDDSEYETDEENLFQAQNADETESAAATDYRQSIDNLLNDSFLDDAEIFEDSENNDSTENIQVFDADSTDPLSESNNTDNIVTHESLNSAQSISAQNLLSEDKKEFLDTSRILNELFDTTQYEDNSYTGKLVSEKYTGSANIRAYSADTYFNDFTDSVTDVLPDAEKIDASSAVELVTETENVIQKAESQQNRHDNFINYNTPVESKNEDKQIIEREYKNVLGRLLGNQSLADQKTKTLERTTSKTSDKNSPLTDEMRANIAKVESKTHGKSFHTIDSDGQYAFIPSSKEDILNKNLTKMAEQTKQFTGDTVKNRVYDSRIDTIYRTQYHYYSNKLKLFQYAILFGIMLLETIFTFLLVRVGLKVYQQHDAYFYIASILIAAALPITAAAMNFIDSDRIKTGEFRLKELKESLFYKTWVMACCLILIYCVNISFLRMPASFSKDYLATLLLPSLLTLCLPLSSVIFYFLYNSRRFNRA